MVQIIIIFKWIKADFIITVAALNLFQILMIFSFVYFVKKKLTLGPSMSVRKHLSPRHFPLSFQRWYLN